MLVGATTYVAMWSNIEQGLAITSGSLATLRPLLRLITRKLGMSTPTPGDTPNDRHYPSAPRKRSKGPFSLVTLKSNAYGSSTADDRGDEVNILEAQQEPFGTKASESIDLCEVTNKETRYQAPTHRHVLENREMDTDRYNGVGLEAVEAHSPGRGRGDTNTVGEFRNSARSSIGLPIHPLAYESLESR